MLVFPAKTLLFRCVKTETSDELKVRLTSGASEPPTLVLATLLSEARLTISTKKLITLSRFSFIISTLATELLWNVMLSVGLTFRCVVLAACMPVWIETNTLTQLVRFDSMVLTVKLTVAT